LAQYVLIKHLHSDSPNRKLFYADIDDITTFPVIKNKADINPGSEIRVIDNGAKYILNSNYEWEHSPVEEAGITDAPVNGNTYGRKDRNWVIVDTGDNAAILTFSPTDTYS
jgi:hypothetical protein